MERRKEKRLKAELPFTITYLDKEIHGTTENISRLGAYVEAETEIPLGTDIGITLELPACADTDSAQPAQAIGGTVSGNANVFRCSFTRESENKRYYGIGIFFISFSGEESKEAFSRYIEHLAFQEEQDIKAGLHRWREKRDAEKDAPKTPRDLDEIVVLLKEILQRLDKIQKTVSSRNEEKRR